MLKALRETANWEFFQKLALIAIPVTLHSLLGTSKNVIDVIMLGQLGKLEVAAVGAGGRPFFVTLIMIFGMGSGCGVLASQYWGKKDREGVRKSVILSILWSFAVAIPCTLLFSFGSEFVVGLINKDPVVIAMGGAYLSIVGVNLLFATVNVSVTSGLKSIDQAVICTGFSVIGVGLNIFLNYVLIFGNFGAPQMGVMGAAWATMISAVVEVLVILAYIFGRKHMLAFSFRDIKLALDPVEIRRFLSVSMPIVVNGLVWSGGIFIYFVIYGRMGTDELAIMTMISPIESVCISFYVGLAAGAGVILGQNLGAGKFDKVWKQGWLFVGMSILMGLIIGGAFMASKDVVLGNFSGMGEQTLEAAKGVYMVFSGGIWLKAINVLIILGLLRSGGDTKFCLYLDAGCQWLVGIPLGAFGAFVWGFPLLGVFALVLCEELVKVFLCFYRVISKVWIQNLVDNAPVENQEAASVA